MRGLAQAARSARARSSIQQLRPTYGLSGALPLSSIWLNSNLTSASVSMLTTVSGSLKSVHLISEASVIHPEWPPVRPGRLGVWVHVVRPSSPEVMELID